MFEAIDRSSEISSYNLYKTIVDRICLMIKDGTLKVGDKLPSERELAELFQVSRIPVREALKILDFMGIIQYVRGGGVYVKKASFPDMIEKIDLVVEPSADILVSLFDAREAIELKAVELACLHRSDDDIAKMEKSIADLDPATAGRTASVAASREFHTLVVRASRNQILVRLHENLIEVQELARERLLYARDRVLRAADFHRRILEAIVRRDSEAAVSIMRAHLQKAKGELMKEAAESGKSSS
jgi:GntR family transcriptional repressor for pyruvate dehydrogenase complex